MSTLDEIRARLDASTPGPWTAWNRGIGYEVHDENDEPINSGFRETFTQSDADLIANAPADMATLLAAVDAVLALHANRFHDKWDREHDTDQGYGGWCNTCGAFTANACPTVRAVAEALGGTE